MTGPTKARGAETALPAPTTAHTLAIASGKGGTGKTTVAVSLAFALARQGTPVHYIDCDVEEPNGHLFLKPLMTPATEVGIPVPIIDPDACTACRTCADFCEYNALLVMKTARVFPELCHGCGGCSWICPTGAIREQARPIGVVETGAAGAIGWTQGRLKIGEPMSPPLIRAVKRAAHGKALTILDAPPGTACPVVATVRDADYVILVTEPTPFGLSDLRLAVDLMRNLKRSFGVVINRAGSGHHQVQSFCASEGIAVLAEIPDDRRVAEAYSRGELPLSFPAFQEAITSLYDWVHHHFCATEAG